MKGVKPAGVRALHSERVACTHAPCICSRARMAMRYASRDYNVYNNVMLLVFGFFAVAIVKLRNLHIFKNNNKITK